MATENRYKTEFVEILKATGRENIDYVIEDLEDITIKSYSGAFTMARISPF